MLCWISPLDLQRQKAGSERPQASVEHPKACLEFPSLSRQAVLGAEPARLWTSPPACPSGVNDFLGCLVAEAAPPISSSSLAGNGSALVRLLQEGACKLEEIGSYSEEELQCLLRQCDIPFRAEDSKVGLEAVLGTGTFWWAVFLTRNTNPCHWALVWDRGCWRAGEPGR